MRLRFFALDSLPPLSDIQIRFEHEEVLNRQCAIRFIVGVNGTGKTRLLQALTEIFLYLEQGMFPPFQFSLAYDLHHGKDAITVVVQRPDDSLTHALFATFHKISQDAVNQQTWKDIYACRWNEDQDDIPLPHVFEKSLKSKFVGGELPGLGAITAYLPQTVVAYTSGKADSWQTIFAHSAVVADLEQLPMLEEGADIEEFPSEFQVSHLQRQTSLSEEDNVTSISTTDIGHLITDNTLLPAVSAMTLYQAVGEVLSREQKQEDLIEAVQRAIQTKLFESGFRGILNEIGWLWPESLHFQLRFAPDTWSPFDKKLFCGLFGIASSVIRLPGDEENRLLSFDLFRPAPSLDDFCKGEFQDHFRQNETTGEALFHLLTNQTGRPFEMFRHLDRWIKTNVISNITLTVRKTGVDDILLYEWLSDGERMFLGRMALFHLLRGENDALLILDEPETHFNDVWKRRIVDIIDDSLRYDVSEVLISTHSSISLTDVFDTEITLLRRISDETAKEVIAVVRTPIPTFGALPSEIMREIFGAPETVGQRATEFLDMMLIVAAHPRQLESVWAQEDIRSAEAFEILWQNVQKLPHTYEDKYRLVLMLEGVKAYTQKQTGKQIITAQDALQALQSRLGPGYYQFEFRRRLRALNGGERNVS